MIWSKWRGFDKTWVSDAEAIDYKTRVHAFEDAGAWGGTQVNLTSDGADPARVGAASVTPNVFAILGVQPREGRVFTDEEARPQTPTVCVISDGLWRRRFGAADDVVGKSMLVNGIAREIVGIMPRASSCRPTTSGRGRADAAVAAWLARSDQSRKPRPVRRGAAPPGVTVAQANAELTALAQTNTQTGVYPVAMQFGFRGNDYRRGGRRRCGRRCCSSRRGRIPAAHRVRERREPAARPRGRRAREMAVRARSAPIARARAAAARRERRARGRRVGPRHRVRGARFEARASVAGTTLPRAGDIGIDAGVLGFSVGPHARDADLCSASCPRCAPRASISSIR